MLKAPRSRRLARVLLATTALLVITIAMSAASAAEASAKSRTLFTNVHVFDGVNEKRIENANVLVEGNLIKNVSTAGDWFVRMESRKLPPERETQTQLLTISRSACENLLTRPSREK